MFLVSTMPNDDSKFWTRGIPLCEAWLQLLEEDAPGYRYRERLIALQSRPLAGKFHPASGLVEEAFAPREISHRHEARFQMELSLQWDFHAWLESGEVQAFGLQIGPMIDPQPKRIPSGLFAEYRMGDHITWEANRVRFGDLIFADVRVLRRDQLVKSRPSRPRGRPRKRDQLEEAALIAKEQFQGFCDMPRKLACDHVRDVLKNTLKIANAEIVGKSDKTISKAILKACGLRKAP